MKASMKMALAATGVAAGVVARRMYWQSRERELKGEVVLITGGSRGLGLALARQFAHEGCRLAICARDREELERARAGLAGDGAEVIAISCDVKKRSEVQQLVQEVTAHFGRIDILITNAGTIQVGPVQSVEVEDFEDAMDVMFWGTVYPTLALLPAMMERNRGHLVHITSIGGKVSVPHLLPYTSAKYAATGFSEGLRTELVRTGVMVTTIAPGLMRTGSYNAALFKGDQEAEAAWFSLGASMPGLSMDADRAARQILTAVKRGDSEKVLTAPASVLARLYGMAPSLIGTAIGLAGTLLLPTAETPAPAAQKHSRMGRSLTNLQTPKMKAALFLGRMAARRFNQKLA